jgi:Uma2 family endonuclease
MEPAIKKEQHYTYADYCALGDEIRYEVQDGMLCVMEAPTRYHQGISVTILRRLSNYVYGKPQRVFHAPFDVRFNADGRDDMVLQPDIIVVCDCSILNKAGCAGVPDMVVEILSPTTASRDRLEKFNIYLRFGVCEYWIVDPDTKTIYVNLLQDGRYVTTTYIEGETAPVHVLPGCEVDVREVFEE